MGSGLMQRLRGARGVEIFAAIALVALLALMLLGDRAGDDGGTEERTPLESRLEAVLSGIEGTGPVSVMITEDGDGQAVGALIVARELKDVRTYLSVQRAVMALLGLQTDRIEIIGAQSRFGGAQ